MHSRAALTEGGGGRGPLAAAVILAAVLVCPAALLALGSSFTYQGRLEQDGTPVTGGCDFSFSLFDGESGGNQVGATIPATSQRLTDGLFSVEVDFGPGVFVGDDRWLEIRVRCPQGSGDYAVLGPRQHLTATPYALFTPQADSAGDLTCAGCVGSADLAGGAVTSAQIASGAIQQSHLAFTPGTITSITAGEGLTGGTITTSGTIAANIGNSPGTVAAGNHTHEGTYWALGGNAGTSYLNSSIGTTDNQPLDLKVFGSRALRLEPRGSPNLIGGWEGNSVTPPAVGATIGGGGAPDNGAGVPAPNRVLDDYGTIGGGLDNQAGSESDYARYATVAGGFANEASGPFSAVGGGLANRAKGQFAGIGGGSGNLATGQGSRIGGGTDNTASADFATVGGGRYHSALAAHATIAGGGPVVIVEPPSVNGHPLVQEGTDMVGNRVFDEYGAIGGGGGNTAGTDDGNAINASLATVGGGGGNNAQGLAATVGGGALNRAGGNGAVVGGGLGNEIMPGTSLATIAGGGGSRRDGNRVCDSYGTVSGGTRNRAGTEGCDPVSTNAMYATVGGGEENAASAEHAAAGGGTHNSASGSRSTVGGGYYNEASGNAATVPGGADNVAGGAYSFAAGAQAQATHAGSFVWSSGVGQSSWGDNTFTVRAPGGFRFYYDTGTGYCQLSGSSGWQCVAPSDRNGKLNLSPVSATRVLERVARLPLQEWSYRESPAVRHIGPMAQDFHAAFGVGEDDTHINTVDADGVALAAIQGLYRLLQEKDAEIAELGARIAAIELRNVADKP